MVQDDHADPDDPLGQGFQDQVLKRGKRLEELRIAARSDPKVATQFAELATEQLEAYQQLIQATARFPTGEMDSPQAIFRAAMAREIQQLRDDVKRLRSQGA